MIELFRATERGNELLSSEEIEELLQFWDSNNATFEAKAIEKKRKALWDATDAYIHSYLHSVALSVLSMGVQLRKPKAITVMQWIDSIWEEYNKRMEAITPESEVDMNYFDMFGNMPFSLKELREEIAYLWEQVE